jgi:topoisomerase-4 subunit A
MAIKGRSSLGNILTKYPVKKIVQRGLGKSTLGAKQVWMDQVSGRLNCDERGQFLGAFDTGDQILTLYKDGTYEVTDFDLSNRYDPESLIEIRKFDPTTILSTVYFDGHKGWTVVKRFVIETTSTSQRFPFITDHKNSRLYLITTHPDPEVEYKYRDVKKVVQHEIALISDLVDIKGWKALGNLLVKYPLDVINLTQDTQEEQEKYQAGDTIDFDLDARQGELFE